MAPTDFFVRQGGKVFGPFDSAKLKHLVNVGKLGPQSEIAPSSGGPWTPASNVNGLFKPPATAASAQVPPATPQPVAAQPAMGPAVPASPRSRTNPSPKGALDVTAASLATLIAGASAALLVLMPLPPLLRLLCGCCGLLLGCAVLFGKASRPLWQLAVPLGGTVFSFASVLLSAATLFMAAPPPARVGEPEIASRRTETGRPAATCEVSAATGPPSGIAGEAEPPPREMAAAGESALADLSRRYTAIPEDAKDVLKALKKLEARLGVGISFAKYSEAIEEVYPNVSVFNDSQAAREMPELRLLLSNACDCYLVVRKVWAATISADNPVKRYDAQLLLLDIQDPLWEAASANIAGATVFVEGPPADLPKAKDLVSRDANMISAQSVLARIEAEKQSQASKAREEKHSVAAPSGDDISKSPVGRLDLESLIYKDGDLDAVFKFTAKDFTRTLPKAAPILPPSFNEGCIAVEWNGKPGFLCALLYDDAEVAKQAFKAAAEAIGATDSSKSVQTIPDLGDEAGAANPFGGSTSVFRRGKSVVIANLPIGNLETVAKTLKSIDNRLAGTAELAEMVAP